jgi:hypothetical protein
LKNYSSVLIRLRSLKTRKIDIKPKAKWLTIKVHFENNYNAADVVLVPISSFLRFLRTYEKSIPYKSFIAYKPSTRILKMILQKDSKDEINHTWNSLESIYDKRWFHNKMIEKKTF